MTARRTLLLVDASKTDFLHFTGGKVRRSSGPAVDLADLAGVDAAVAAHAAETTNIHGNTPWAAYTPTNVNVTVGNGTQVARWRKIGGDVFFRYSLVWGTTTAYTGQVSIGLPVASHASGYQATEAYYQDAGTRNWVGSSYVGPGASLVIPVLQNLLSRVDVTEPFTWATGDILAVAGHYEPA